MTTTHAPLNFGIIGLGAGAMNMIPELHANPNARIAAAADLRPAARERFAREFGGPAYESAEALCGDPSVDVVYVMTPDELHAEHTIMAAERGKQVILDKPMGLTLDECDAIIEAAERNGVRVLVGHSQSLDLPQHQARRNRQQRTPRQGRHAPLHVLQRLGYTAPALSTS